MQESESRAGKLKPCRKVKAVPGSRAGVESLSRSRLRLRVNRGEAWKPMYHATTVTFNQIF